MKTLYLNGKWSLRGRDQENSEAKEISIPATVPGCVALDLAEYGYLPKDLFMGMNITKTEDFESYEWWYEKTFNAPIERERVYLVFEGVDTLAEYYLNGKLIGESKNMLISHEFDISDYLIDGENKLTVHISSTALAEHEAKTAIYSIMSWHRANEIAVRRAPHTYGWDIMPRMILPSIWRDVKLEVRNKVFFSQVFFKTDEKSCEVLYEVGGGLSDISGVQIRFFGNCGDSTFDVSKNIGRVKCGRMNLCIKNPKSWWPYGYGDANVYDVTAEIFKDGVLIHEEKHSFGLRSVILDRTDTTNGSDGHFRFIINGKEIMCRGSNWVPLDAFHCRDAERYDRALELVRDIGCNILRCWGGNVYEDHKFYDFCDRNGVMVWQDFTMACHLYPETEDFKAQLYAEAEAVIKKLRNHPSIILWSGDNEIDENLSGFTIPGKNSLTREVLPKAVRMNDVGRPYLASSPYISDAAYCKSAEGLVSPELHIWGPRDYYKSEFYTANKAHFVSETGYHGCPSMNSIKKFITPDKIWPYTDNEEWNLHSTDQNNNPGRVMLMEKQVRQLFGKVPENPEEYITASQISEAEADKYFIERIRVGRPLKSGIIWWNLLDGWPQMSDAVVDYYFEKKLAYGYIKRAQAPFTIAAKDIESWGLTVYACNDTLTEKEGTYKIIDADTDSVLAEGSFSVGENRTAALTKLNIFYSEKKMLIFEWEIDGKREFNHYLCGYPPFDFEKYKSWMRKYNL